jgi:hypothetical protein
VKWLYADSQSFPSLLLPSSQITLINPLNLCTCHSCFKSLLIESPPLRCTHHHRPWNLLLKVIGETLAFVSSTLLKRYLLFYLGMFVLYLCVGMFICLYRACGIFFFWADFCCFKAGYTQFLANAAGTFLDFCFVLFLNEVF